MQTRFLKFLFLPVLSAILGHGIRRKAAISVVAMLMLTLSLVFPASATTETDYVTFSVGGFTTSGFNSPLGTAPTDPVTGSFTVTFDPTQGYAGDTADITLNSLTITTPGSPIAFDYYTSYPGGGDLMYVGGTNAGVNGCQFNTNDFCLVIDFFHNQPFVSSFTYTVAGRGEESYGAYSTNPNFTESITVTTVPLPATLLLFGSGLLGLGGWRRFRKS